MGFRLGIKYRMKLLPVLESRKIRWMPDQVRHDEVWNLYGPPSATRLAHLDVL